MYNHREIEENVNVFWKKIERDLFKTTQYDQKKNLFAFLEGPPTANAEPGLHHVEVRVFKDLFCRFKNMRGFNVARKGGWDCHGLPVEVQVEKHLKLKSKKEVVTFGVSKFIEECKKEVFKHIKEWEDLTKRMAHLIDLKDPYVTLTNPYMESVWWSLKELHKKGMLYEDHKVVPYCPRCETPLSSHEVALGYKDLTEDSVVIKFKVKGSTNRYFLVWTTTPWTLPSNLALAVNKDITYAVVKKNHDEFVLAKELVEKFFKKEKIVAEMKGSELKDWEYEPIFDYFKGKLDKPAFKVILANFVTTEEGTGIVHQAPAFGEEDYEICKENGLAFVQPVTTEGKFTNEVNDFNGMFVKDADEKIIKLLDEKKSLFDIISYTHKYPFCWRCDSELIYFAMKSWFIKVSSIRDKLIKINSQINWYPNHIKDGRFGDWLENAKDWALSRSKFWGTPLPIWRCECDNIEVIGSIKELLEKSGLKKEIELHKPLIDNIKLKCKCGKSMDRISEVIDTWYDSGSAFFAQFHYPFENKELFEKSHPYDFIAEAIDQTRGWFYTLHVISSILFDKPAYRSVVCAGHMVDEKGEKMSKSKGNVLSPNKTFDQVGVDAVRLQFCQTAPCDNKRFGIASIKDSIIPFFNILWNCYKFYDEIKAKSDPSHPKIEDEWLISKTNSLIKEFTSQLEIHNYHHCMNLIQNFVIEDLSRWYIKIIRPRALKHDGALKYTFDYVFDKMVKLLAPFAPYLSEFLYKKMNNFGSVHLSSWPKVEKINESLEEGMSNIRDIVQLILAERNLQSIGVRWPLKAVKIFTKSDKIKESIDLFKEVIMSQTNIKEVLVKEAKSDEKAFEIELDTSIDKELEKEGYSRELIRRIQGLRKKSGLKKHDKINLIISSKLDLKGFEKEISSICGAKTLKFNEVKKEEYKDKFKVKGKEFEIGFDVIK